MDTKITTGCVTSVDGIKIAFDQYSQSHQSVIILAHGFFNSKKAVLFERMAHSLGNDFDVIVMDFRGHGKSNGFFDWTASECQDVEAIVQYARKNYRKVGVIGFSLGAAVSLIAASKSEQIDSLISVSAPSQFEKIDFHILEMSVMENIYYNVFQEGRIGKGVRPGKFWLNKTRPIDIVDKICIPVLFLQGDNDWLVRPWHAKKLYHKATSSIKRLKIIKNGTHAEYLFRSDPKHIIKIFTDWFEETLG